jgi:hypothetical protein
MYWLKVNIEDINQISIVISNISESIILLQVVGVRQIFCTGLIDIAYKIKIILFFIFLARMA